MPKDFKLFACMAVIVLTAHGAIAQAQKSSKGKEYVAANSSAAGGKSVGAASLGPNPEGYLIGIDDELQVSVWHEPELSQGVVVRPDGMITLPLLNDVKVAGLTTREMQALLTEGLKPFVNEPQVTIIVKTTKSRKVYLIGAVGKPGAYPLTDEMTAVQLVASAGGPGLFAKTGSMYVLRGLNGKQARLAVNYKRALSGKGGDVVLQPGDMLVVP
jgi:polysaccharide export outer membrane protein